MKLINSTENLSIDKQYVCGQLHGEDSSWEVWSVLNWDTDEKVFYVAGNLFDDGKSFTDFKFVYELPSLKQNKNV